MNVFRVRVSSKIRCGRQVLSIKESVGRTRVREMTQEMQEARSSLVIETHPEMLVDTRHVTCKPLDDVEFCQVQNRPPPPVSLSRLLCRHCGG